MFDSGLGGLSVLQAVRQLLPAEPLVYLADQARVPYGPRPCAEVCVFAEQVTRFLLVHEARLVVVACNTASARPGLNQIHRSVATDAQYKVKARGIVPRACLAGRLWGAAGAPYLLRRSFRRAFLPARLRR